MNQKYQFESWISDSKVHQAKYSSYWNNEDKKFPMESELLNGNFSKLMLHLEKTELPKDLKKCIDILKIDYGLNLRGTGLDLAAGSLWSPFYLLQYSSDIEKIYCIEYSKYRLEKIGPCVLDYYNVPKDKVILVYGSFYELNLDNNSVDFVFFSQGFHHADDPEKLLVEVKRVLKPEGVIIIIGEHCVLFREYLKHPVKYFISKLVPGTLQHKIFKKIFYVQKLFPSKKNMFPREDDIMGDHIYTIREYNSLFSKHGFRSRRIINKKKREQSFVLVK